MITNETDSKSQVFKRLCKIGLYTSFGGTIFLFISEIIGTGIDWAVILGASVLVGLFICCAVGYYLNNKGYPRLAHNILVYASFLIISMAFCGFGTTAPLLISFMLPITLAVVLLDTCGALVIISLSVVEAITLYITQRVFNLFSPIPIPDEAGQIIAGIAVAVIVIPAVSALMLIPSLERKRAEEATLKSERKYRSVVETIQEVIFQTDEVGKFTYLNPAWTTITGYNVGQTHGQDIFNFIVPEDKPKFLLLLTPILEGKETVLQHTLRILRKDNSVCWVELIATVNQYGQDIRGSAGTLNDISKRVQAENLERDRSQILEMVAANRQLKEILNQIVMMVESQSPGLDCTIILKETPTDRHPNPSTQTLPTSINTTALLPTHDTVVDTLPVERTYATWVNLPILSRQEIKLGTLIVDKGEKSEQPSSHELALFEMARQLAAIAIEQNQLSNLLLYQTRHDPLTRLPNRSFFEELLKTNLETLSSNMLAVLFVDLDRFKLINDTLGHQVGDGLLKQVAKRLDKTVRLSDIVARRGGDEFTAMITNIKSREDAKIVAQNFLKVFIEPFIVEEYELFVSPSIGISIYPDDGATVTELERKADSAMYYAKELGRNNFQFFNNELYQKGSNRLKLGGQLRRALERNEFVLYYQPKLDILSMQPRGFEALIRWLQPEAGLISPADFIPLAEETGLIVPIGQWVLKEACHQLKTWHNKGFNELTVAINVSALQFEQADFEEDVAAALRESELEGKYLELELSENLLVRDTILVNRKLERLKKLGVRIAMDDFGTGYSSLSYLQKLPIDILKIDQSFVKVIEQTFESNNHIAEGAIARTIIVLGHSLGMHVVAEGVETLTQLNFLREVGCEEIQGYLVSKPLIPENVEEFLEKIDSIPAVSLRA